MNIENNIWKISVLKYVVFAAVAVLYSLVFVDISSAAPPPPPQSGGFASSPAGGVLAQAFAIGAFALYGYKRFKK